MTKKLIFLLALLLLIVPQTANAHPADMYFHTFQIEIAPAEVTVNWELVPGAMITHVVWHDADTNGDDEISDTEAKAWIAPWLNDFQMKLDGSPLDFKLVRAQWAASLPELRTGESPILIVLRAPLPDDGAPHNLALLNNYNSANSLNWFNVSATEGSNFAAPEQDNGLLKLQLNTGNSESTWESGQPSIPPVVEALGLGETAEKAVGQAKNQQGILAILEGFLRTPQISPMLFLTSLAIALILGALHALSPGHGKTIVAAYLIGSNGKAYHAAILGLLVTLTHTGSVFILGLATLFLSQYIMPTQLFPFLELLSGILILVLGVVLLVPRLRVWLEERKRTKTPAVAKRVEKGTKGTRLVLQTEVRESGGEHNHDPSQFGYVPIPTGAVAAADNPLEGINWRSLIALGISGGLIPCPDAIAILLVAITINRIAFGLSLIVSFSLGLAIVLIAIGIIMVESKQIFARLRWFSKASFVVPVISALVVLGLGAALSISAVKKFPDKFSFGGDSNSFSLRHASVVYLAIDENYHKQLYLVPAKGGNPRQITEGDNGVWNYSVAPDRKRLIYAIPDGKTGSELWFWEASLETPKRILSCPEESCSDVVWFRDREQILYSRLTFEDEQAYLGIPSVWWLDLESGETQPLFQDAQLPGYNPRWSADGVWLSYTSANPQRIQVYNLKSGERQSLPTEIGSAAVWSPNQNTFLLPDLQFVEEMYLSKIFYYDVATQEIHTLPSAENNDDSNPSWSPDGEWITFSRGEWTLERVSSGDQIWISRPDGQNARPLTEDADTTHGPVAWSPDERYLLYRAYAVSETTTPSQVRILDMKRNKETTLAAPGDSPFWFLP